ncbi:MFS general substrate transporter [Zalerion maritima]|uniref:MFS general substrate transporter n=1 Tax=Zalerion maritima TaxID=339359 RepID=A0AAD5RPH9_9PEZI|nr:MFS general substrate transporter [Zalerion maritima]
MRSDDGDSSTSGRKRNPDRVSVVRGSLKMRSSANDEQGRAVLDGDHPTCSRVSEAPEVSEITLEKVSKPSKPPQVRWRDLSNKPQLVLLALCQLSEQLSNVCRLPYIFHLVISVLDPDGHANHPDSRPIGGSGNATFVAPAPRHAPGAHGLPRPPSSNSEAGAALASKISLLSGVGYPSFLVFSFPSSPTLSSGCQLGPLPALFFWRALFSAASGNIALMRSMTAETVEESKYQARAFLLLPLVFNSGRVASLALGGVLTDPKKGAKRVIFSKEEGYEVLEDDEVVNGEDEKLQVNAPLSPTPTTLSSSEPPSVGTITSPSSTLIVGNVLNSISLDPEAHCSARVFCIIAHFTTTHSCTFSFWLPASAMVARLSLFGIPTILLQLFIYPRLQSRLGTLGLFRRAIVTFPGTYVITPMLSLLPLRSSGQHALLACVSAAQILVRTIAMASTVILLAGSAPERRVLGTVHGTGNTASSLANAIGPAVGGAVHAAGVEIGAVGLVWWIYLAVISVVACERPYGFQAKEKSGEYVARW